MRHCHLPCPILEGTGPLLAEMTPELQKGGIRDTPGQSCHRCPFLHLQLLQEEACRKSHPSWLSNRGESVTWTGSLWSHHCHKVSSCRQAGMWSHSTREQGKKNSLDCSGTGLLLLSAGKLSTILLELHKKWQPSPSAGIFTIQAVESVLPSWEWGMSGAEVAHDFAWDPTWAHILGMETHLWPPVLFLGFPHGGPWRPF